MTNRKHLPRHIEKEIYQQFHSKCPFCTESNVAVLQIHHITPYADVKEHNAENLILVCSNCHQRITAGQISEKCVRTKKEEAKSMGDDIERMSKQNSNVVSIQGDINDSVVANTIVIKQSREKKTKVAPPDGSIASNLDQRNYIMKLIERYHEFKIAEVGKANMKYPMVYSAIKKKFGAKWDMIRSDRFEEVVNYMQGRIDRTVLGRNRKSKGERNYSTYDEYMNKYAFGEAK